MNVHIDSFIEAFLGDGAFVPTVADAVVGPSRIAGSGLFTSRARRAGELLAELDGQLVEWERFPQVLATLEWNAVTPELLLVRPLRTSYGLINHSSDPNVVIDPDGRQMRCGRDGAGRGVHHGLFRPAGAGGLSAAAGSEGAARRAVGQRTGPPVRVAPHP